MFVETYSAPLTSLGPRQLINLGMRLRALLDREVHYQNCLHVAAYQKNFSLKTSPILLISGFYEVPELLADTFLQNTIIQTGLQ